MVKGTSSFGKRKGQTLHIHCRRCGRRSYNVKDNECSACGYGKTKRIKGYSWQTKSLNRSRLI